MGTERDSARSNGLRGGARTRNPCGIRGMAARFRGDVRTVAASWCDGHTTATAAQAVPRKTRAACGSRQADDDQPGGDSALSARSAWRPARWAEGRTHPRRSLSRRLSLRRADGKGIRHRRPPRVCPPRFASDRSSAGTSAGKKLPSRRSSPLPNCPIEATAPLPRRRDHRVKMVERLTAWLPGLAGDLFGGPP